MRFVDAHLHLSDYQDPDWVADQLRQGGFSVFAVGVDKQTSLKTLELARRTSDLVRAFVGVHPSEAGRAGDISWIDQALEEAQGCGEVGLDPAYPESEAGRQASVFRQMLQATEKAGKPLQLHARGAENTCFQELTRYRLRGVLMHWFEEEGLVPMAQDRGYFISVGPALLYSRRLQRIACSYDRHRILTESDGPVAFKALGGVSGPGLVPSVVFKLAELWGTTFSEAQQTLQKSRGSFLRSGEKG